MDGERLRKYWSNEAKSLLNTYKQFETLVPSSTGAGADHAGEDGRFVEELIRGCLRRYLPASLEVLTGFIVRAAVKTGKKGRERDADKDAHSSQLDIIVYDSAHFPIFQRFGDNVVVVPEGVVGIISVKKTLRGLDIGQECSALTDAARLCQNIQGKKGDARRGPFLAVIAANTEIEKERLGTLEWVFREIQKGAKAKNTQTFDELVGYVGVLARWSIFKRRPAEKFDNKAYYIGFEHKSDEEHLGLQFLLTGLLSAYYDHSRNSIARPGFTAFPPNRPHDKKLGSIDVFRLR